MENAFLPRAENAFSPKGINGISDWLGRNFFADRSAKQFPTCLFYIKKNSTTASLEPAIIYV